jgi:uncharacterized protein YktA (UPF0223 family)
MEAQDTTRKCKPFYLNLVLKNKDEVVASKVAEKAGKGLFGKAAAFAANKLISDEKILENLAEKLIDGVSRATADLGINAELSVKFQEGPFVVIVVQVNDVDTLSLILTTKGEEFASSFSRLLEAANGIGVLEAVEHQINDKIYGSINEGMMKKFKEIIPQKLAEQGVIVECITASAADEAEIFFEILSSIKFV